MRVFAYRAGGRAIEHHGSRGFTHFRVGLVEGGAALSCVELAPGGVIGRHEAASPQLLLVVEGSGYVSGADRVEQPIAAGQAVHWERGEAHETRTDGGLVAIIVEADSVEPAT